MDYEKDISIDPLALDVEWLRQPRLYIKYAEKQAKGKERIDVLKQELKVCESRLLLQAAEEGEDLIGSKPTVSAVEAWVKTQKEHIDLVQELNEADYNYNILSTVIRALEHKKTALENLVRLWQGSYFAGPKEPRELTGEEIDHKFSPSNEVAKKVKPKIRRKADVKED